MSGYRVVDGKGFFARSKWDAVALVSEIQRIRDALEQGVLDQTTKPKDREVALKVLEAIEALPQIRSQQASNLWELEYYGLTSRKPNVDEALYAVGGVDKFSTVSDQMRSHAPSERWETWGLEHVETILAGANAFSRVAKEVFPKHKNFNTVLKPHKSLYEKLKAGEVRIKVYDPLSDMVQVDSFAIYIGRGKQPGFLDGRGNISPLAGARMFESQASAQTTIRSRGLVDAVVVKLKATLVEVCPNQTSSGNLDDLMTAISHIEKQDILKALDLAEDGALQEALDKRQQPKRRM